MRWACSAVCLSARSLCRKRTHPKVESFARALTDLTDDRLVARKCTHPCFFLVPQRRVFVVGCRRRPWKNDRLSYACFVQRRTMKWPATELSAPWWAAFHSRAPAVLMGARAGLETGRGFKNHEATPADAHGIDGDPCLARTVPWLGLVGWVGGRPEPLRSQKRRQRQPLSSPLTRRQSKRDLSSATQTTRLDSSQDATNRLRRFERKLLHVTLSRILGTLLPR